MAGRKKGATKLTDETAERLVDAFKRGLTKVSACESVGISRETLRRWLDTGKVSKSGKYKKLFDAIEEAKQTFWDRMADKLEQVAYKDATEFDQTVDVKLVEITKLTPEESMLLSDAVENSEELREIFQKPGVLVKKDVTIKQHRPSASRAIDILSRRMPEKWAQYQNLKLEMDIKSELAELGLDADTMLSDAVLAIEQAVDGADEDEE